MGTNKWRVIWKETLVGTINGVLFAVLAGLLAALWFQSSILGVVIAMAMIINLIVAGLCGAGIPLALHKMGSDPGSFFDGSVNDSYRCYWFSVISRACCVIDGVMICHCALNKV